MKNRATLFGIVMICFLLITGASHGQVLQQKPIALIDIVMADNRRVLKTADEATASAFLKMKNERVLQYLAQKYPQFGVPEIDKSDPSAIWFGLICAMYEANDFKPIRDLPVKSVLMTRIPLWLTCTLSVIGATLGITELVGTLGAFSYASVWTCVKFVVKKYVTGWLGTAVALYEIASECF